MKSALFLIVGLFELSALAAEGPSVSSFTCVSDDGHTQLTGLKQTCADPRYAKWQRNGCYHVSFESPTEKITIEMVRDVRFELEQRQKFYSFMNYGKDEWVLQGLALEMTPTGEKARFRFDTHANASAPFVSTFGQCEAQD